MEPPLFALQPPAQQVHLRPQDTSRGGEIDVPKLNPIR